MKRATFAVPGHLDTPTGGYAYDKRIIAELRNLGWQIDVIDLGDQFPFPDAAARQAAFDMLGAICNGSIVVIDGLAFGVLPDAAEHLSKTCPIVALVHHPLALETGLAETRIAALRDSEIKALRYATKVIVTSEATRHILGAQYGVNVSKIEIITPGIDRLVSSGLRDNLPRGDLHLLSVGSLVARKGYDILIDALAELKDLRWRLTIAGDVTRDRRVTERVANAVSHHGLTDRVTMTGAVSADTLRHLYADADVFVLASRFEGYGMVFGEAVAAGLPVVATDVGNARDILADGAGVIVPPNDAGALQVALRQVITSADRRASMASAARRATERLPDWRQSGANFANVLERLG